MNILDVVDGPLDPRIQIELEKLNNATDDINKLEIELEEANTALNHLLTESTIRLTEIVNKIGPACLEKAKCYYDALDVLQETKINCQERAQQFQRENAIHTAAKETVALAETRFLQHKHEWNFDQAWQEVLNHAIIKVREAEHSKAECAREHHKWTVLFHDTEEKVQQLEEKYRRSIRKAKPYFDMKAQYDQIIPYRREQVDCLKKAVQEAKASYAASLRALEEISNQIHERRRDFDILASGPREPGVGAELATPEECSTYEEEMERVRLTPANSLISEPEIDERALDFEDVLDLKQRVNQLTGRSADGSESTSNQWELELQASIEKLNKLPYSGSESDDVESHDRGEVTLKDNNSPDVKKNDQNKRGQFDEFYQSWQSLTQQSPFNSFINKSKIALKNSFSRSLTSSPMNKGLFSIVRSKIADKEEEPQSTFKNEENGNRKLESQQSAKACNLQSNVESESRRNFSHDTQHIHHKPKAAVSLNSTPVRCSNLKFSTQNSNNYSVGQVKELPLLSLFQQQSTSQKPTIDKSCSMINLNEKQNLKTLLDSSELNIQAVSIERLANARHNLVGDN